MGSRGAISTAVNRDMVACTCGVEKRGLASRRQAGGAKPRILPWPGAGLPQIPQAAGLGGGGGAWSNVSSASSTQAQAGALARQMLAVGLTEEGASSVPTRTTVNPGRPVESEKR